MPENPIYNPNNIVRKETVNDNVPVYNPNNIVKKEVVKDTSTPISKLQESSVKVEVPTYRDPKDLQIESTLNFIQENSLRVMKDDEKEILRAMMKNPLTKQEELSDAIVTLQGKKAKQIGNSWFTPDYYMDKNKETGNYVPKALEQGEKVPRGKDVASIWGTQPSAEDDTWYQDLGKTLFNAIPGAVGSVVDVLNVGTQLVTGEESETLTATKQATEALKFKKDSDLNKPLYNFEGVEKFSDLIDVDRFDFSPQAVWGTFNSMLGSVGEAVLLGGVGRGAAMGAKGLSAGLKGSEVVDGLGKAGRLTAAAFGSYANNLKSSLDAADEIGLQGRDRATFALISNVPVTGLDFVSGLDGKILSNMFGKSKAEMLKEIGRTLKKDAAGNILPEEFKRLAKETTKQYSELIKLAPKEIIKDVVGEGGQEAAQAFALNASKQLWDAMSDEDKAKFGVNAFSAKSWGQYINEGLSGLAGGAPIAVVSTNVKRKHDEQSINVYNRVKEGSEAVAALRIDLANALEKGELTQQEYDNANYKINSYQKYEDETKGMSLNDESKKRAFELSFQIEGLKTEIPTNENEISKLDPITRAKVESKQSQVKALQKELNDTILKGEIKQEPVVGETIETKAKKEGEKEDKIETEKEEAVDTSAYTPEELELFNKYKIKPSAQPKAVTPKFSTTEIINEVPTTREYKVSKVIENEKRGYAEIPNEQWNDPKFDVRVKQYKLAEELDKTEAKTAEGVLEQDTDYIDKDGHRVDTFRVTLPDGKSVRFASSMFRRPDEKAAGGFRGNTYEENLTNRNNPIGQKVGITVKTLGDSGRRVIFVWNAEPGKKYGKHLGMVKESLRGVSNYSQADLDEMADLRMTNMGTDPTMMAAKPEPTKPTPTPEEQGIAEKQAVKTKEVKPKKQDKDGKKSTDRPRESATGDDQGVSAESTESSQVAKLRTSKRRVARKIKDPNRKRVANEINIKELAQLRRLEDVVKHYFASGGFIDRDSVRKYFDNSYGETFAKQNLTLGKDNNGKRMAPTIEELSEALWNDFSELNDLTNQDYRNAIETVLRTYDSPIKMAKDLLDSLGMTGKLTAQEQHIADGYAEAERLGIVEQFDSVLNEMAIGKFGTAKETLNKPDENLKDISKFEGDVPFQKAKREKVANEKVQKIVDKLKKVMPKIKVELDENLSDKEGNPVAGQWDAKTGNITINPFYADTDTPIHEYGHILIDAMGYNNKIIQAAINQLKSTDLWKETKRRYPELSEESLGKEVLAEAIGREGAGIFEKESDKSKFRTYLEYIFDWFKQKLGLDKNIAKSLAKQVISGRVSVKKDADIEVQFQKTKEEGEPKKKKPLMMSNNLYRKTVKLRNLEQEDREYAKAKEKSEDENLSEAQRETWKKVVSAIDRLRAKDKADYRSYVASMQEVNKLQNQDLGEFSMDELINIFTQARKLNKDASSALLRETMLRIATALRQERIKEIKAEHKDYVDSVADKKDLSAVEVKMKVLSHFTEAFPELQKFSVLFDEAVLNKTKESNDLKLEAEKLAKAVIKEKNKQLGLSDKFKGLFSSDSAKYFEYMENPNAVPVYDMQTGDLIGHRAGFWTIEEAKQKGFSEAQINYLRFMRDLVASYQKEMGKQDAQGNFENMDMEVLRVDKNFSEAYRSEGLVQAFSYYLGGGGSNLGAVRIAYNGQVMSFAEIEKDIIKKSEKGILEKAKAIAELLYYNYKARKQLKTGKNLDEETNPLQIKSDSQYGLDWQGNLTSKFSRPRSKDRGYSKDYYRAMMSFIDDVTHVKHMNPLMPVIDSIEYLNKHGWEEKGLREKLNTAEWIDEWKKMQIFREPKENDPIIDAALKTLRKLTSATTMLFNVPAQGMNAFIGNYNNWRAENGSVVAKGNKRLFFDAEKRKESGRKGVINPYAADIIRKYAIVSLDLDSNPRVNATNVFEQLGSLGTRWGEYQLQGSLVLGLMTDEDYNSFEYKTDKYGVKKLQVKDTLTEKEKRELDQRMTSYKNRVSDIQGKYAEKDRRNIMRGEFGKAIFQFKVWIPDWWKERFGEEYIDRNGKVRKGSFRSISAKGIKELRKQIRENGFKEGFLNSNNPEAKAMRSNLKGLMVVTALLVLKYQDDEDEEKRKRADFGEKALSDLLFIFDPDNLIYTIKNPIAAVGTSENLIKAGKELVMLEEDSQGDLTGLKRLYKVVPAKKIIEIPEVIGKTVTKAGKIVDDITQ